MNGSRTINTLSFLIRMQFSAIPENHNKFTKIFDASLCLKQTEHIFHPWGVCLMKEETHQKWDSKRENEIINPQQLYQCSNCSDVIHSWMPKPKRAPHPKHISTWFPCCFFFSISCLLCCFLCCYSFVYENTVLETTLSQGIWIFSCSTRSNTLKNSSSARE